MILLNICEEIWVVFFPKESLRDWSQTLKVDE